ncbi:hypothetical protein [Pseudoduganella albidiflava]|uniref:DUF2924 domain-containing protein n=1 Tax=Pseudoduganella albidiflava TaxID=321983 RepID=A0A411X0U6_9BURK|nr:hypothetical protein [Pseudoduganella albidiflava]QBI02617.1 hypothetical protein EYF70_18520 [Pseudoduganella albidiflava]GGY41305.1 hypothetical protein GCM10007387_24050 [Pseudoduganella albidiflava]
MEYEAKQPVYLPVQDFLQLELHLAETRPGAKVDAFLAELVRRWLATETIRQSLRENGPALRGFQWKTLFLPEGTILRTTYGQTAGFAKVGGDHIVSDDGATLTPSQFANRHARGRNAWRFIWLRFPGDDGWVRADNCRAREADLLLKRSNATASRSKTI